MTIQNQQYSSNQGIERLHFLVRSRTRAATNDPDESRSKVVTRRFPASGWVPAQFDSSWEAQWCGEARGDHGFSSEEVSSEGVENGPCLSSACRRSCIPCAHRIWATWKRSCSSCSLVSFHSSYSVRQCSQRCGFNAGRGWREGLRGRQQRRNRQPSQRSMQPRRPGMVILQNAS